MFLLNVDLVLQVYWLDISYLDVAEAALHCSASMTALLYVEEWYKQQFNHLSLDSQPENEVSLHVQPALLSLGQNRSRQPHRIVSIHPSELRGWLNLGLCQKAEVLIHAFQYLHLLKQAFGLLQWQVHLKTSGRAGMHGRASILCYDGQRLLLQGRLRAEQLLVQIYSSIKEPDSIYAVTRSHQTSSLLPLLEHEGSWSRALLGYDLQQQAGSSDSQNGIVQALKQLGCRSAVRTYLQGLAQSPARTGEHVDQPYNGREQILLFNSPGLHLLTMVRLQIS